MRADLFVRCNIVAVKQISDNDDHNNNDINSNTVKSSQKSFIHKLDTNGTYIYVHCRLDVMTHVHCKKKKKLS